MAFIRLVHPSRHPGPCCVTDCFMRTSARVCGPRAVSRSSSAWDARFSRLALAPASRWRWRPRRRRRASTTRASCSTGSRVARSGARVSRRGTRWRTSVRSATGRRVKEAAEVWRRCQSQSFSMKVTGSSQRRRRTSRLISARAPRPKAANTTFPISTRMRSADSRGSPPRLPNPNRSSPLDRTCPPPTMKKPPGLRGRRRDAGFARPYVTSASPPPRLRKAPSWWRRTATCSSAWARTGAWRCSALSTRW